ncbi:MAG: FAD:protein FMN transferase [Blautia sp.]|nr:FAD:protein FMN transferase [Blautia sp.]
MKLSKRIGLIILSVFFAFSVPESKNVQAAGESATREFFAMDTVMAVSVNGKNAEDAADAMVDIAGRIDAELSTGNEKSEVSVINAAGEGVLTEDGMVLMKRALSLYEESGGLFDISIYPVMELWGFTTGDYHVPEAAELDEAMKLVDASAIVFDEKSGEVKLPEKGMKIDFGGIAKGYTSACMTDTLRKMGIESALVNLGGNVQALGSKPDGSKWRVGIRDPEDDSGMLGVISISDLAVITSGGYERFFEENGERYHHIIDPRTGHPAESGLISVTIVSSDGVLADGLSTFLYIAGEEKAVEFWRDMDEKFDMILEREDGTLVISEGIEDIFNSERSLEVVKR